jgi:hypothetical protein
VPFRPTGSHALLSYSLRIRIGLEPTSVAPRTWSTQLRGRYYLLSKGRSKPEGCLHVDGLQFYPSRSLYHSETCTFHPEQH